VPFSTDRARASRAAASAGAVALWGLTLLPPALAVAVGAVLGVSGAAALLPVAVSVREGK
jgi:hypothetical protein